jgi:hypothetical protein
LAWWLSRKGGVVRRVAVTRISLAAPVRTPKRLQRAATWNDKPRPFVWTKTAEQILESIARYCERINQSRH